MTVELVVKSIGKLGKILDQVVPFHRCSIDVASRTSDEDMRNHSSITPVNHHVLEANTL